MAVYQNTYAITISPPSRYARCTYLLDNDVPLINKLLGRMSFSYRLYPEFADGRLHYHGVVYDLDMIKMNAWKYKLDKLGFTLFKKIKDEENFVKWIEYCTKQWNDTLEVFKLFDHELEPIDKMYSLKQMERHSQTIPKTLTLTSYGFRIKNI